MGEVYRATDTKLARAVAIKLLPAEVAGDPERLARFQREAQLLASLNHPNIAAIHGLEEAEGKPFLVLELVEGEDLAARLARGPLPVDEALEVARQVALALEEAHGKSIVHRDLKPANVKVTPDGQVKVLDFGLAKARAGEATSEGAGDLSQSPTLAHMSTQAGVILGTAAYMAPEQARGRPVDKRADIWAFGVLVWEMLTGRRLFAGETVSDTLAAILKEELRYEELPAALPAAARRMLRRCLVRDPRDRLHDIADARIELLEAGRGDPAAVSTGAPSARPVWRRWAASTTLLALGAGLGAVAVSNRSRPPATPGMRFTLTPASEGSIRSVLISRNGRRIVYVHSGEQRLVLQELDAFESRPLPGTEGAGKPFLSPDGRFVGFYQAGRIRKLALDGGDPIDICEAPEEGAGAVWGPGDVILFNPTWTDSGLWRVSAAGGRPVELTKPARDKGETSHFWASFLPDGDALFTIFGGQGLADSRVGLLDTASGRYEILFEGASAFYTASGHIVYYKGGAYRAVPFDAARHRVTGPEATVLRQVRRLDAVGDNDTYVHFSDTGVAVLVEGDSTAAEPRSRLVWAARDGRLQELPFEAAHGDFRLSPDGKRVVAHVLVSGQKQIVVYDLERGTTEQISREGQNFGPAWHPDGRRVAWTTQMHGSFDLVVAPADGTLPPAPLLVTPKDEGGWRWAPDGQSGVFQVWSAVSGTDLWRASGDGAGAKPFVASPLPEGLATFSPDGRWMAYGSGNALYVTPYPALGERVLIAPVAQNARWSRASTELFYVEQRRLKAVRYDTRGGSFRLGAVTTLFDVGRLSGFDIAPDGSRLLFLKPTSERAGRDVIRVVTNGFDLLRPDGASTP